jgi:hypothetical protein
LVPQTYLEQPLIDYMVYVHKRAMNGSDPEQNDYMDLSRTLVNATAQNLLPSGYNIEMTFDDELFGFVEAKQISLADALVVVSQERIYIGSINKTVVTPIIVRVKVW